MIKNTVLTIAATTTLSVLAAAPAMAGTFPGTTSPLLLAVDSVDIPEPTTVLGLLTVGGGLISQKKRADRQASK